MKKLNNCKDSIGNNNPKLRFKVDDGSDYSDWEEKRLGDIGRIAMCKRVLKEQTSLLEKIPFYKIGVCHKFCVIC